MFGITDEYQEVIENQQETIADQQRSIDLLTYALEMGWSAEQLKVVVRQAIEAHQTPSVETIKALARKELSNG